MQILYIGSYLQWVRKTSPFKTVFTALYGCNGNIGQLFLNQEIKLLSLSLEMLVCVHRDRDFMYVKVSALCFKITEVACNTERIEQLYSIMI